MSDAVIITLIICAGVVLLGIVGSRKGTVKRTTLIQKPGDLSACCAQCGRSEGVATWNGYAYCPGCGAQIKRG